MTKPIQFVNETIVFTINVDVRCLSKYGSMTLYVSFLFRRIVYDTPRILDHLKPWVKSMSKMDCTSERKRASVAIIFYFSSFPTGLLMNDRNLHKNGRSIFECIWNIVLTIWNAYVFNILHEYSSAAGQIQDEVSWENNYAIFSVTVSMFIEGRTKLFFKSKILTIYFMNPIIFASYSEAVWIWTDQKRKPFETSNGARKVASDKIILKPVLYVHIFIYKHIKYIHIHTYISTYCCNNVLSA